MQEHVFVLVQKKVCVYVCGERKRKIRKRERGRKRENPFLF